MILLGSKLIRKTDLNCRLSFPTKLLRERFSEQALPGGGEIEMEIWDVKSQRLRNFVCKTRNGEYPKPVVRGRAWMEFVQENKLEVGDKILFFAEDHGVRFRIDVEKATANSASAAPAGTSTSCTHTSVVSLTTLAGHDDKTTIGMDGVDTTLKLSI